MKSVLTRRGPSGGYDECGASNRLVTEVHPGRVMTRKAREFGKGHPVRVEEFSRGLYKDPTKTYIIHPLEA